MRTLLEYAQTAATCEIWGNRIFATDMPTCRPKLWTTHMHTHRQFIPPDPIRPDPTRPNCSVRCVGVTGVKWIIINDKSNVLFYLLPALRDVQLTSRLRCARQYPTIYARTNRYKNSFILFGLNHAFRGCQNPINGLRYRSRRVG